MWNTYVKVNLNGHQTMAYRKMIITRLLRIKDKNFTKQIIVKKVLFFNGDTSITASKKKENFIFPHTF